MITKPAETIEEESENLKSTKNALIISNLPNKDNNLEIIAHICQ